MTTKRTRVYPSDIRRMGEELNLPQTHRHVLHVIHSYQGGNPNSWPSLTKLARGVGVSKRHLIRMINDLEEWGVLTRERRGHLTNWYRVVTPMSLPGSDLHVTKGGDTHVTMGVTPMSPGSDIYDTEKCPKSSPVQEIPVPKKSGRSQGRRHHQEAREKSDVDDAFKKSTTKRKKPPGGRPKPNLNLVNGKEGCATPPAFGQADLNGVEDEPPIEFLREVAPVSLLPPDPNSFDRYVAFGSNPLPPVDLLTTEKRVNLWDLIMRFKDLASIQENFSPQVVGLIERPCPLEDFIEEFLEAVLERHWNGEPKEGIRQIMTRALRGGFLNAYGFSRYVQEGPPKEPDDDFEVL